MRTFAEKIDSLFDILGNSEQLTIFNEWASETGNEVVYYIEEFDEVMQGFTPSRLANMVRYGDYNPNCDYFTFDGYGNLESIENVAEYIADYITDMCRYFEDHEERLADICDEWNGMDEEDDEETEKIPAWALPAIVNHDYSGLEDEDIKLIEDWFARTGYTYVNCPDDEPYFSPCPAFGPACDVYDCICD